MTPPGHLWGDENLFAISHQTWESGRGRFMWGGDGGLQVKKPLDVTLECVLQHRSAYALVHLLLALREHIVISKCLAVLASLADEDAVLILDMAGSGACVSWGFPFGSHPGGIKNPSERPGEYPCSCLHY